MLVKQPGKGENHRTLYQQLTYAACTGCCVVDQQGKSRPVDKRLKHRNKTCYMRYCRDTG